MKKLLYACAAFLVAALTGCQKELTDPTRTISFSVEEVATRTEFTTPNGTSYPVLWQSGDKVVVFTNSFISNQTSAITASSDRKTAKFTAVFSPTGSEGSSFSMLSPSSAFQGVGSGTHVANITVPASQTPATKSPDAKAQVLVNKKTFKKLPNSVTFTPEHLTAYVKLSLTNASALGTLKSVTLTSTKPLAGTVAYSFDDKTVTPASDATKSVTATTSRLTDIWFATLPAAVAGTTLTVKAVGSSKTMTREITIPSGKNLESGKIAVLSVDMNPTVHVTGVSLNKTTLSLEVGKTETLTATVTPSNATDKSVTWKSSNTSVATVSTSGVVTAKAVGSATITVTTNDGGKTATCAVTVKATTVPVTGVSLNKTSLSLVRGNTSESCQTETLTATVTPSNATDKSVTWSSSNTSVATVSSSGLVTAKGAGTATITVTTNDGGKTATCAVTVKKVNKIVIQNYKDGVDPLYDDGYLHITPNIPATIQYVLTYSDGSTLTNSGAELYVYSGSGVSISGRKVTCTSIGSTAVIAVRIPGMTGGYYDSIDVKTWSDPTGITATSSCPELEGIRWCEENKKYTITATVTPSTARQKIVITPESNEGNWDTNDLYRGSDSGYYLQETPHSYYNASDYTALKTNFKIAAWHNASVYTRMTFTPTPIDVTKPKMFDFVAYNSSTKRYQVIDGGLRILIKVDRNSVTKGVRDLYMANKSLSVPSGYKVVGIVTAYFTGDEIEYPTTTGLATPSQLVTYGPDGTLLPSGKIHGFAISMYNATADIWCQDYDDVSHNDNFSKELQGSWSGHGSMLFIESNYNQVNGFNLTIAAHQYNVWRGSSHAIRVADRVWDYGEPGYELTCRPFPNTNPSLTFVMRPWFVPTVWNWLNLSDKDGHLYNTKAMNQVNAQITKAGFGNQVFPYETDSYWTINDYNNDTSNSMAAVVYSQGYAQRKKSNSAGIRPFLIF